jgi:Nicotinate phosphoribosyltransferase C-terminal domain
LISVTARRYAAKIDVPAFDSIARCGPNCQKIGELRCNLVFLELSLPGRKQVFRAFDERGAFYEDLLGLADEDSKEVAHQFSMPPSTIGTLLSRQFADGRRLMPRRALSDSRDRFRQTLGSLPARYKDLENPDAYPVRYTAAFNEMLTREKLEAAKCQD